MNTSALLASNSKFSVLSMRSTGIGSALGQIDGGHSACLYRWVITSHVIASPDLSGRGNLIPHQVHRDCFVTFVPRKDRERRDCGACSELRLVGARNLVPRKDTKKMSVII